MAKKNTETALEKSNTPFDLSVRPDFIKEGDVRGSENVTSDDIKPPALRLAQANSKAVKRSEAEYIDGLREGDFYDSLTREIYGEDVRLIVVNMLGHRNIEFEPGGGGGIIDYNVPDGDPRTQFREVVEDGKKVRKRPQATKLYDYLVLLVRDGKEPQLMQMSLKGAQLKKAVQLNTLLTGLKLPFFSVVFDVTAVPENGGGNSWMGWKFTMAGWASAEQFKLAETAFESLKGKNIALETEGDEEPEADKIPF